jgi:hypothetical protein
MSLNGAEGQLGPFLFVLRERQAVGAVEMWETRSVFQGQWAAVGNRRAAPIAAAMAVFHRCPLPVIPTALRVQNGGRIQAPRLPMRIRSWRLARCIANAASVSD